jgi:DNA-binding GntR family transcriptional regulator
MCQRLATPTGSRNVDLAVYVPVMPTRRRPPLSPPAGQGTADAYDRLLALIVRGALAPATRLTEPMVVQRLGISRTPAREVMHRLRMEGLLVADGGGERPRVAVAPLDVEEARALYQTTGLLEGAGARVIADWAVRDRTALAVALRRLDALFRAATRAAAPDPESLFRAHHGFHQRLVEATATTVTRGLLESLQPRLARYEWFHGPLLTMAGLPFSPTYDEHDSIVDAVRNGTARQIESTIRTNWSNAAERLSHAILRARAVVGAGPVAR